MDKETLSTYGWIVICVMILAVLLALASPFGNFVAGAVKATAAGLFDVNQNALDVAGIVIPDQEFEDPIEETPTQDPDTPQEPTPQIGDVYDDGEYIYCYGYKSCADHGYNWANICGCESTYNGWAGITTSNLTEGWSARVKDPNKTSYGPMLTSIGGVPITDASYTYYDCWQLTDISRIVIPSTVKTMQGAFIACYELTDASGLVIPNSVEDIAFLFCDCENLLYAPSIPSTVTRLDNAFQYCRSLAFEPELPSFVTNSDKFWIFFGCTSLGYGEL